ncbi:WD40 repeat domain-containing protein [Phytohabitans suffuscus]|uniref:WD40 repeat domain-containing protein n=1 Tax=Phytohabitans suffuscus TaxID=624315 RepID=UPI0015635469|nr:hypothetical protein [Phytohabitans suffuscus]
MSTALLGDDGAVMAVGDSVGDIHIWAADEPGWRRLAIHDNGVAALAIARVDTGYVLVTGGRDGTVRLVQSERKRDQASVSELKDHGPSSRNLVRVGSRRIRQIRHAPRSPDTPALTVFSEDNGRLSVMDTRSGDVLAEHALRPDSPLYDAVIVPGEPPWLVTLHRDDLLTIRPAVTPGPERQVEIPRGEWWTLEVDPAAPHTVLLTGSAGVLAFVDVFTGTEVRPKIHCHAGHFWMVTDPVRHSDVTRFVTATKAPTHEVVQWTLTDDNTVKQVGLAVDEAPDGAEWPYMIWEFVYGWHHGRRILAGAGTNSHVQVWDAEDGSAMWSGDLQGGHHKAINAVEISRIGGETYVLTGGHTCTLGLLSLATGEERHLWVGSQIWSIAADTEHNVVIGGVRGIMNIEFRQTRT